MKESTKTQADCSPKAQILQKFEEFLTGKVDRGELPLQVALDGITNYRNLATHDPREAIDCIKILMGYDVKNEDSVEQKATNTNPTASMDQDELKQARIEHNKRIQPTSDKFRHRNRNNASKRRFQVGAS